MCASTALTGCERLTCHTHPITAVCKSTVDSNVTHDDRFGENLMEMIKPALKDGTFWSLYDVKTSPPDGHCLIHSLARCVNSQTVQFYDTMTLLRHLHFEIITNATYYLSYIKGGTCRHLFSGMERYIYHRQYKTGFCDLVPYIMSNALNMNILIIELFNGDHTVKRITPRSAELVRYTNDISCYLRPGNIMMLV